MHRSLLSKLTLIIILTVSLRYAVAQGDILTQIASDLLNPRGVAVLPSGQLIIVEAGDGVQDGTLVGGQGRVSLWQDRNNDGDFVDADEQVPLISDLTSYNGLQFLGTGHDEVDGVSDVVVIDDTRVFFSLGNLSFDSAQDPTMTGIGIMEVGIDGAFGGFLIQRPAPINSIAYEPATQEIYLAESGLNELSAVRLDRTYRPITRFSTLASDQQAVPTGLAIDPSTRDVFVSLFSGLVLGGEEIQSFAVGDAKVVRVNPQTGETTDEITGLTTAIDVATDELGNLYVVEMTTAPPPGRIPRDFPLTDPDAPVVHGGYERFSGRVTRFAAEDRNPTVLAEGLDTPTNITYHDGMLYVSVGQGTPNRPIPGPNGANTRIAGQIYTIDLALLDS